MNKRFLTEKPVQWRKMLQNLGKLGALLLLGYSLTTCSTKWKEEVQLHDGSKIIVERSQNHGGRHEFTQRSPIKEHDITFTVPSTNRTITWKNEYDETIGYADLNLLALHILNATPYIVTSPHICLAYNKWGRPNPPYVVFRHDGNAWQRIRISELPVEFKDINLLISTYGHGDVDAKIKSGFVTFDSVKELNSNLKQKEFKSILREAIESTCEELIYYKGGWVEPGNSIGKQMRDSR